MWLPILVTVLTGYLLGNLNGAVSVSQMLNDDVRKHGSGNAGLTNFIRNYGAGSSLFVIFVDVIKAVLACLVGQLALQSYGFGQEGAVLGGVAVSLGHDFPALLGFKGGKGILCGLSIAAVVDYRCALLILAVFVVLVVLARYVSLGSVVASLTFSGFFAVMYFDRLPILIGGVFIGLMAVFMHRGNIVRLLKGTERKFSFKKESAQ